MSDRIIDLELFQYSQLLKQPLMLSGHRLEQRQGLLLKWTLDAQTLWSEVSPLPGYSGETMAQCVAQLQTWWHHRRGETLTELWQQKGDHWYAAVNFGIKSAWLALYYPEVTKPDICPLLSYQDDLPVDDSRCIKLKVGLMDINADIGRIQQLLDSGFHGRIRLDANQSWGLAEVEKVSQTIDTTRLQWFEEPLLYPDDYRYWSQYSNVPFAYDECLYQQQTLPKVIPGLAALIVKPTLLGLDRVTDLLEYGQKQQLSCVLSSCFEGPVAMAALYRLVHHFGLNESHGLDTLKYFQTVSEPHLELLPWK